MALLPYGLGLAQREQAREFRGKWRRSMTRKGRLSVRHSKVSALLLGLLLFSGPAMARPYIGDGDISHALLKLAPPGALLAMAAVTLLIGCLLFAARRASTDSAKQSLLTLALLLVLPLLGLVVWYQPLFLVVAMVALQIYIRTRKK